MSPLIEIIHRRRWHCDLWDEDTLPREGWQVRCSEHGLLGNPAGWAYETPGRAQRVVAAHRAKHERMAAQ